MTGVSRRPRAIADPGADEDKREPRHRLVGALGPRPQEQRRQGWANVSELNAEISVETAMVKANCRKN